MRRRISEFVMGGRVPEPSDELDSGPVEVKFYGLDDGNVVLVVTDRHDGIAVIEVAAADLRAALTHAAARVDAEVAL